MLAKVGTVLFHCAYSVESTAGIANVAAGAYAVPEPLAALFQCTKA